MVKALDFYSFPDKKRSRFYPLWNSNFVMRPFDSVHSPTSSILTVILPERNHEVIASDTGNKPSLSFDTNWQIPGTDVPTGATTKRQARSHNVTSAGPGARPLPFFKSWRGWAPQKWVIKKASICPQRKTHLLRGKVCRQDLHFAVPAAVKLSSPHCNGGTRLLLRTKRV